MRLQAINSDYFLHLVGVLDEGAVPWQAAGANELNVPDDTFDRLGAELLREVARSVRMPEQAPEVPEQEPPPVEDPPEADGTEGNAAPEVGDAPPRSGAGATRDAWAAYAGHIGVSVPSGASRDEIIALVDKQEAHGGS
jgi:hypothetical protein